MYANFFSHLASSDRLRDVWGWKKVEYENEGIFFYTSTAVLAGSHTFRFVFLDACLLIHHKVESVEEQQESNLFVYPGVAWTNSNRGGSGSGIKCKKESGQSGRFYSSFPPFWLGKNTQLFLWFTREKVRQNELYLSSWNEETKFMTSFSIPSACTHLWHR